MLILVFSACNSIQGYEHEAGCVSCVNARIGRYLTGDRCVGQYQ